MPQSNMVNSIVCSLDQFLHGPFGARSCRIVGWLRIWLAAMILIDQLVLSLDLEYFFNPKTGLIPVAVAGQNEDLPLVTISLLKLFPESRIWVWTVHLMGILGSVLALLGVQPRLALATLFVCLSSFHNSNVMLWDNQDIMFRLFVFMFLFCPLDHITIYDRFGTRRVASSSQTVSWPVWPIRVLQIEMFLIYTGASAAKFMGGAWLDGTAVYYTVYYTDYYPGLFNPDIVFDRKLPLMLISWITLFLETVCLVTAWIPRFRTPTVVIMCLFHLGIDICMNMHLFEWMAMLGWCVFLVQPEPILAQRKQEIKASKDPSSKLKSSKTWTKVGGTLLFTILSTAFALDALPTSYITLFAPRFLAKRLQPWVDWHDAVSSEYVRPWLSVISLRQGTWDLYDGLHHSSNIAFRADLHFTNRTAHKLHSPDWMAFSKLGRKRQIRRITYFSELENHSRETWWMLERMAQEVDPSTDEGLVVIDLYALEETAPPMSKMAGWFDPVVQPMIAEDERLVGRLHVCRDHEDRAQCQVWREQDKSSCWDNPWVEQNCRKSCGHCTHGELAVMTDEDEEYGYEYAYGQSEENEGDYEGYDDDYYDDDDYACDEGDCDWDEN